MTLPITFVLPTPAWLSREPLADVLKLLSQDGAQARVVGGAVRNTLLGEPRGDIDIATTVLPDEVVRRAQQAGFKPVPTGIGHGTVTVVAAGEPFEVTTLRADIATDGRHATVAFGTDWAADAARRDFTINAFSVGLDGVVHDYVGGGVDLAARRIRFIGDPATRIAEDYLRILRFFRFHARCGAGNPDAAGLAAVIAAREGLATLSRERVRAELLKLLVAPGVVATMTVMAEAGLVTRVTGGVPLVASLAAMAALEAGLGAPPCATRRLAALAVLVPDDAQRLRGRLALTNAEQTRLDAMSEGWWRVSPDDGERAGRALLYDLGRDGYVDRVLLAWSRVGANADEARWRDLATLPERWTPPGFPLKAADFIARGVAKGPALGRALAAAEKDWIGADFPRDAAAIGRIADAAAGTTLREN